MEGFTDYTVVGVVTNVNEYTNDKGRTYRNVSINHLQFALDAGVNFPKEGSAITATCYPRTFPAGVGKLGVAHSIRSWTNGAK